MIELLLDDHIPRVWVIRIVVLITLLLGKVCLSLSLIPLISTTASSAVVVIIVETPLGPSPGVLFGHTVLLKMADLIASPAPNVDASSWPSGRVPFFLLLS